MITVFPPPTEVDENRLTAVIDKMKELGAPVIRAAIVGDGLLAALEGAHRLAAAAKLGIAPIFIAYELYQLVDAEEYEWGLSIEGDKVMAVGTAVGLIWRDIKPPVISYKF